jgi:hypothetical protein
MANFRAKDRLERARARAVARFRSIFSVKVRC